MRFVGSTWQTVLRALCDIENLEIYMKKTLTILGFIVGFSLLAYVVVISSYVLNFGTNWSTEQGDWGTFGDFIGGTLNPLLSFMALIALLITIVLQSKELEQTRVELSRTADANEKQSTYLASQQERDDAYRLISKLAERINNTYNKNHLPNGKSIHAALSGALNVTENDAYYELTGAMMDPLSSGYSRVKYIESDLRTLAVLLDDYEVISAKISTKQTPIKSFYISEYAHMVKVFCSENWFDRDLLDYYAN